MLLHASKSLGLIFTLTVVLEDDVLYYLFISCYGDTLTGGGIQWVSGLPTMH